MFVKESFLPNGRTSSLLSAVVGWQAGLAVWALDWTFGYLGCIPNSATDLLHDLGQVTALSVPQFPFPTSCLLRLQTVQGGHCPSLCFMQGPDLIWGLWGLL